MIYEYEYNHSTQDYIYTLPFISPQTRKLRCDGITDDEPQLQSLLNGINTLGGGELRRSIVTLRWEAL